MLVITVPGVEYFDEKESKFVTRDNTVLELEHSLLSLSKWEEIHEKPFLGHATKTNEEVLDYVRAMILTKDYPENTISRLTQENVDQIVEYIDRKMSATWFTEMKNAPRSQEIITNELIYYWMSTFGIPKDHETWHLNRLFTLIKVHNAKSQKPKKMTAAERSANLAERRALNEKRQREHNTSG